MNKKSAWILAGVLLFSLVFAGVVNAQQKLIRPGNASIRFDDEIDDEGVCTGEVIHPVLADLAGQYGIDYEELLSYFCEKGFGVGEIKHALVTAELENVEIDYQGLLDWAYTDEMGWGEIWQELGLIGMGRFGSLEENASENSLVCSGERVHPVLAHLAEEYSLDYEMLLPYFCEEGFGIGELRHALKTAQGGDIEETWMDLLEAREGEDDIEKTGWGVIWRNLGLIGKEKHGKARIWPDILEEFPENIVNDKGNNKPEGHPGRGKGLNK